MSLDSEQRVREALQEYAATTRRPTDRLDSIMVDVGEARYQRRSMPTAVLAVAAVILLVVGAITASQLNPSRERLRVRGAPTVPTTSGPDTSSSIIKTTQPSTPPAPVVTAPTVPISLSPVTVQFPQDGVPNDNKAIGPFCCTGRTATILDQRSSSPVGYIYYLSWEGQAYNIDSCFATPSIKIQVSGLADLNDKASPQQQSEILIYAKDYVSGMSRETIAGQLTFRVTFDGAEIRDVAGNPSFYCPTSTKVRVDIDIAHR